MRPRLLRPLLLVALAGGTALAQPMAALKGTPLPASDLSPGTVSVRVVAGNVSSPVSGVAVTLSVNGTPREARTDDEGRAFFKELPVGATVQAKIVDDEKKDVTSEQFQVPGDSGIKLMLSTRPLQPGMGGAPFAGGGAGGMPDPRKISGTPRPAQEYPAGTYAVRLTYDDLQEKQPPAGVPVALVAYKADKSVSLVTVPTDATGHAKFADLDRTGATAYFALALLPRGSTLASQDPCPASSTAEGRCGPIDRLMAQPVTMAPQVGATVMLSADKRTSSAPAIDDTGDAPVPAGTVHVTLDGAPDATGEVQLIDVESHAVVAKVAQQPGPPDPTQIQGSAPFEPKADLPPGTLDVEVTGGQGTTTQPLDQVGIRLVSATATEPPPGAPTASTDATGKTRVTTQPGVVRALVTINGREIATDTFDLTSSGGVLHVEAHWPDHGSPIADLAIVPRPGEVVYAEATERGEVYRSRPIQLVPDRGAHVSIAILPRTMFTFSWTSHIDDEFLAVQGTFDVYNNSWIPYVGSDSDGILIPLPTGFKGAILADQDQADVGIAQGEGFRIVRPLAPGVRRFVGGFSVPVEGGQVHWHLDLPLGAYQSGIEIQEVPGMSVTLPANAPARTQTDERGTWRVISPITILPKQAMEMTISGLPSQPAWRVWVPRVLGVLVIVLLAGGIGLAIARGHKGQVEASSAPAARRQQLLDELVALEQRGEAGARREQILAELEHLWDRGTG